MKITNIDTAEKTVPNMQGAKGVLKQIPISKQDGTPNFSFRVFTIEPGGHTPLHSHDFEHLNYVIEGSGTVVSNQGQRDVSTGDFVLVMPGETHQYRNTSNSPLLLICAVPKEYE